MSMIFCKLMSPFLPEIIVNSLFFLVPSLADPANEIH